jgi:hypothetical protein
MAFCQDGRLVDDRRSLDRLGITDGTKIDVLFTDSDVMHFFRGIAIGVFEEDGALEDVIQFLPPSAAKETARLMDVRDRSLEEGLTREITEFTQEDDATPSSAGTNVSYSAATEPSERPLPRLW